MAINIYKCSLKILNLVALVLIVLGPTSVTSECTCDAAEVGGDKNESLKLKLASLPSILVAGAIGVSLPLLGKRVSFLSPDNDIFFMIKAFAAGVILCTGFIHILPDAFDKLASPCLSEKPWGDFPFAGFVAMVAAIGTLMVDTFATGYYRRLHSDSTKTDEENMSGGGHGGQVHVHTHAIHGHAHGSTLPPAHDDLIRKRIISQVLEMGIVIHSVIIGISLGASQDPDTIRPLLVALSFHQFFEGMGLGGCISQAKFKSRSTAIMATFFSLTTPTGIAIGIGITNVYSENSSTALIVEGVLDSAAAGILIYMALVDLLAADFMHPKVQTNGRIQFGVNISLLMGAGCMAVLAKWA